MAQLSGDPLYIGRAIVTGTDNRDRPRGLGICLGQVLVKVSGDPNILQRPGITRSGGVRRLNGEGDLLSRQNERFAETR